MSEQFPRELWDSPDFHKGREWGRMEERERIIKLLANTPIEFWYEVNYEGLVAFIKGETK